ncbi:MAG: lipopolysaccharide transport periplasmic protein LptA [Gammaproteobacteria bacterium]|nr:lipopolysaccharide transport periplasmic protein LptA [Gammaproteobacteria bacterium]MDH3537414.1 lipopolysaccharide transport periplasmic protein LptA [Gammaproteobacteria bacterium]
MATVNKSALLISLVMMSTQLWALDSDSEQPISVEADSLEVRDQENISIYRGNVRLVQGSLEISSDRLAIHFDENKDLVLMEMTGRPARFRQLDEAREEMLGEAKQINYIESKSMLELKDSARFSHAGDTIESNLIRINTENNSIEAGSAESDKRVKMLIKPRQQSTTTD